MAAEALPFLLPAPSLQDAGVDEELSVDGVADLTLEGSERFFVGLALGSLVVEVGASLEVTVTDPGDGGEVEGVVEWPVARWASRCTTRHPDERSTGAVPS